MAIISYDALDYEMFNDGDPNSAYDEDLLDDVIWAIKQCRNIEEFNCAIDGMSFHVELIGDGKELMDGKPSKWYIIRYQHLTFGIKLFEARKTIDVPEIPDGDGKGDLWKRCRDYRTSRDDEYYPDLDDIDDEDDDDGPFPEESDDHGAAWFADAVLDVKRAINKTEHMAVLKDTEQLETDAKFWKVDVQHINSELHPEEDGEGILEDILETVWPHWDSDCELLYSGKTDSKLSKIYTIRVRG